MDIVEDPSDSEEDVRVLQGKTLKTKLKQLDAAKSKNPDMKSETTASSGSSEAIFKFGQEVSDLKVQGEKVKYFYSISIIRGSEISA